MEDNALRKILNASLLVGADDPAAALRPEAGQDLPVEQPRGQAGDHGIQLQERADDSIAGGVEPGADGARDGADARISKYYGMNMMTANSPPAHNRKFRRPVLGRINAECSDPALIDE